MSKFTHDDAMRLIKKMRINYGKKFADQWAGVEPSELAEEMVEKYQDLTKQDFIRGLKKMESSTFVPSIPEFKSWCIGDLKAQWLGANEAWNVARSSIDFNGNELTVVWTKECAIAFDSICDMVKLGDKYQIAEAKKVFIERYDRLVLESLERGERPCYEVSYGDDKEQRKTALREAEIAGYLPQGTTQPMIELIQSPQDAKNEEVRFKTTAQEHLAKLKGLLKVNKPEEEVVEKDEIKLFSLPSDSELWADPFDDQDGYLKALAHEKKPVPMAIKK